VIGDSFVDSGFEGGVIGDVADGPGEAFAGEVFDDGGIDIESDTVAPSLRNLSAVARPIPPAAPVMRATFPACGLSGSDMGIVVIIFC
jgi:hypothetical protein